MTQKVLKILFIFIILFIFCMCYVHASDIDLDIPANIPEIIDNSDISSENNIANQNLETTNNSENSGSTVDTNPITGDDITASSETLSPGVISTTPESGLSVTNIINILLITVGVIIILLAIAIIIRLNSN